MVMKDLVCQAEKYRERCLFKGASGLKLSFSLWKLCSFSFVPLTVGMCKPMGYGKYLLHQSFSLPFLSSPLLGVSF